MYYTIGQVAKMMGLTTHTLRFYDKEGLLPNVGKTSSGIRRFSDSDLNWLIMLDCLKSSGLQLKDIKHYIELLKEGDKSLKERAMIFHNQKIKCQQEINTLKQTMKKIDYKIKYYDEAMKHGEANVHKNKALVREGEKLFKIKKK
ncbi:MAG: MerR family transcriptional regulator [bacterium]|nr:MerR family transcriptional regulator [bacterium]